MGNVHLILGPQGAGKSTYARRLAQQEQAVRFSIDEWMQQLYGPDAPRPLSLPWVMARVGRCEAMIWSTASQICAGRASVVLDLGFTKHASRTRFRGLAESTGAEVRLHVLQAPHALRQARVINRNIAKGETYSFEVTPAMFDFMEKEFEPPTEEELERALIVPQPV